MISLKRLILIGLLLLSMAACQASQEQHSPGLIRVGMAQMPITLDPRFATDAASNRVQEFLHRGLLRLDAGFEIQGDLAVGWSHPEPLLWQFELDRHVYFADGSQLTAADVVATYQAVLDPKLGSPLRAGLEAIASIRAADAFHIEMQLSRLNAALPARLNLGILPARLAQAAHSARATTGCGPFKVGSWDQSRLLILRNSGAGDVQSISFSAVKDPVTRVLKLARGELDFTENDLPAHLLGWLNKQANLTVASDASTTFAYVGINLQDDILRHREVRRALALALDRNQLKRALFADLPVLAETVLSPGHWASTPLAATPYDPAQAERLLDQAGFPRGVDGIRMHLNFRTSTDPQRLQLVTAMASMWQKIGVNVAIESLEWGGFYARIKRGDFQLYSLAWVGINDADIYRQVLHSSMWPPRGANRGRFSDAEVDAWLDQAAASGQAVAAGLYAQVERRMYEQFVYIPLWYDAVIAVYGSRIKAFAPASDGSLLGLKDVSMVSPQRPDQ